MNYENQNKLVKLVIEKHSKSKPSKKSYNLKESQDDIKIFKTIGNLIEDFKSLNDKDLQRALVVLDKMIEGDKYGGKWVETLNNGKVGIEGIIKLKSLLVKHLGKNNIVYTLGNEKGSMRDLREI